MGSNISVESSDFATNVVTNAVTDCINKNYITSTCKNTTKNNITINLEKGSVMTCDNLDANQTTDQNATCAYNFTQDIKNAVNDNLSNELDTKIEKELTQTNKDLNLGQSNYSNIKTDIRKAIMNSITQRLTDKTKTTMISINDQGNTLTLNLDDSILLVKNGCDFNQLTSQKVISSNFANSASSNAAVIAVLNKAQDDYGLKLSQTNAGINIAMIFIIIIILVIGGFLMFGGGTVMSIFKYMIPICIIAAIIATIIFARIPEYSAMGVSIGAVIFLIIFEFINSKKASPKN